MIAASGVRIGWADLPSAVRAGIENVLGSPVVSAISQSGGFSPGTADRVVTASGTKAFVKAVSPAQNDVSPGMHRKEIEVTRSLPPGPVPRFLGGYDDGTWVALVLEDVAGRHPVTPWREDELSQVLSTLEQIAQTMPPPAHLASAVAGFERTFGGWQRLDDEPDPHLAARAPWAAQRRRWLLDGDQQAMVVIAGNSLVHRDIRADNVLLTPDRGALLVDWPHACRGAPWLDAVLLLINVRLYGGRSARSSTGLLKDMCAKHAVPVVDAIAILTASLGYFLDAARRPPPAGLPTVRSFQQAQANALLDWLPELAD